MLELQKVSIEFEERQIINKISFSLDDGDILSIVGESGVGKTSLLRAISGLIDIEGAIVFDNKKIIGPSEKLVPGVDGIATVFQDYQLMHNRTAYENVAYPLRAYAEEEQQSRAEELLNVLMLEQQRGHYPQELSGGQKQRVAIARALAHEPRLLLMDEPFSNMDVALKEVMKSNVFTYLKQEGITTIFVTHDPKDALAISERIAVLKSGRIAQLATPKNIYESPVDPYVMSCFGHCNYWTNKAFELDFPTVNLTDNCTKVAIRVEDLIPVDRDNVLSEVKVIQSVYQGMNYLICGESKSGTLIYFYSNDAFTAQQNVSVTVSKSQIQFFR